ncbi:MAG: RDD family protein [Candidatus Thermoplasmatota archaeon]
MDQRDRYQQDWGLPRRQRFNHASTLRRIGAYIIDIVFLWILTMFLFLSFLFLGFFSWGIFIETEPQAMFLGFYNASYLILLLLSGLIDLAYFTILEAEKYGGATIGKRLLDIKVVGEYGNEVGLGTSFIRNIARLLWQIPCIGFIILIIDVFLIADSEQRIGDMLASTLVVKESNIPRGYDNYRGSSTQPGREKMLFDR